ncbi:MAG: ABC transporter substrate-binding protein [Rubrivivax sp.]|nr:ABC transporter substrate-binding protein [Rubrivivax sp.]MDP3083605.1 ABC transporter substrate-binding protein [Rubrivivax sp.]
MNKSRRLWLSLVIVLPLLLAAGWWLLREPAPAPVKLRFAATYFLGEMLSFVAYDKGYFREQGLEIELSYSTTGWQSLKRLFEGQADVATVAQLPVVYAALDRRKYTPEPVGDFAVVADLTVANRAQAGVARRDRGIRSPADLRGKTVGLPQGTTADFFLDSMLRRNGLSDADVKQVNIDVTRLGAAISGGEVDAVLGWQPHSAAALESLGDNGVLLDVGYRYPSGWLVVFMKDYLRAHPGVADRFLRAMARAEVFVHERPDEARQILARHLKTDLATVERGMVDIGVKLSLSESLLVTLEEQARWAIRRGLSPQQTPPNLLDYFDQGPLRRVKPDGITLAQ